MVLILYQFYLFFVKYKKNAVIVDDKRATLDNVSRIFKCNLVIYINYSIFSKMHIHSLYIHAFIVEISSSNKNYKIDLICFCRFETVPFHDTECIINKNVKVMLKFFRLSSTLFCQ